MALYGTPSSFSLLSGVPGAKLGWFTTAGHRSRCQYSGFSAILDRERHLVLTVATLKRDIWARTHGLRKSMIASREEICDGRAKAARREIMRRHAYPRLMPSVAIDRDSLRIPRRSDHDETVFSYPGLGLATYRHRHTICR